MYNINCASARHIEAFADIPLELADKILAYRKKRKHIFHIDELYRIGGISRKYFRRLVSVFYVSNQVVPRIGTQPPYSNTLSSVTLQQKHQNKNANLKKRKMKIKKHENQRKIENRVRKRKLQENRKGKDRRVKRQKTTDAEHMSDFPEWPPSARRLNINERVARLLKTAPKYEGDNVGMEEGNIVKNRKEKYKSVKKRKTTDTENASEYSESSPSTQRANINERVARLLEAITKSECDIMDMEEGNIEMEEGNTFTYRKRPYQSEKRSETTDIDSLESLPPAAVQRANINERVARMLTTVPEFEGDNFDMEEGNIEMEEDNTFTYRKRPYRSVKRPETIDEEQSMDSAVVQRVNFNAWLAKLLTSVPNIEGDDIGMEDCNIEMEEDNILANRKRRETTNNEKRNESSDSMSSSSIQAASNMEMVARWVAHVQKVEGDNTEMKEGNILKNRKRKCQFVKRQETTDTTQRRDYSESKSSSVIERENNDIMERVARWILTIPKFEGENMEKETHNIEMVEDNISGDEDMCAFYYTHIRR
jgi:hypothetical protein